MQVLFDTARQRRDRVVFHIPGQQERFQAGALSQLGESGGDGQAGKEEQHQEGSAA